MLLLNDSNGILKLENDQLRITFSQMNGAVVEVWNKVTDQYLLREGKADAAFTAGYMDREVNTGRFSWKIIRNTSSLKEIAFYWNICQKTNIEVNVQLEENSDSVRFDLGIIGNDPQDPLIFIEYPVISDIGGLCGDERDQLVSPVATGFLFTNPADCFNDPAFNCPGIDRTTGMYPSGWEYPMQFMAYLAQDIGGFYLATLDGGCTVKSFTFAGAGDRKLRAGICHYLDDIGQENVKFNYEIELAVLTDGYWELAAERYLSFARNQNWMRKGLLKDRRDINKELYEETVLCNFGIVGVPLDQDAANRRKEAYDLYKQTIHGRFLNIQHILWQNHLEPGLITTDFDAAFPAKYDEAFDKQMRDGGDLIEFFDYNTLFNADYRKGTPENELWRSRAVLQQDGKRAAFGWGASQRWYICPSVPEWRQFNIRKDSELLTTCHANGVYHDVGTAAVCPLQCFDSAHAHGTRVNIIPEFLAMEQEAREQTEIRNQNNVGQELIYEQLLPHVDYFQARAAGDLLAWMESDRFRKLLEKRRVRKIPLFDYVYHAYGPIRVDGFMQPYDELGDGYYYAMAFTVLNGGIPEYNTEFATAFKTKEEICLPYLQFADELGRARTGTGKEYLVYGQMCKAPQVSSQTIECEYVNHNVSSAGHGSNLLQGKAELERVVTSAFRSGGSIGIFMVNISDAPMDADFTLEAKRFYGIGAGTVALLDMELDTEYPLTKIEEGIAQCKLTLPSREVVLLVVRPEEN